MYINNKSISNFNASLLESKRGIKRNGVDIKRIKNKYLKDKGSVEGFDYEIKFLIKADDKSILEQLISRLTRELSDCFIQEEGFELIYESILINENVEEYNYDTLEDKEMAVINYTLFIIDKTERERIIEFKNNIKLILNNTETTPCILELTPTQNLVDVTITGLGEYIYIKNLTKDKKVVIDGEKGLVLEGGLNKWKDYDSWSFPKLIPGENDISINKSSINAVLKYKARWI